MYPGIARFSEAGVEFEDGRELAVDTVIMATGYRAGLHDFLPEAGRVADASGRPLVNGRVSALPGLFFCGVPCGTNRDAARDRHRSTTDRRGDRRRAAHARRMDPASGGFLGRAGGIRPRPNLAAERTQRGTTPCRYACPAPLESRWAGGSSLRHRDTVGASGLALLDCGYPTLNTFMCGVGCGSVCPEVVGDGLNPLTMR